MNIYTIQAVYYVESSDPEKNYNPVAVKPSFYSDEIDQSHIEQRCDWNDTDRGAHFFYRITEGVNFDNKQKIPRQFKLIGENGEEMTFTYLTKKIFEEKVAEKVWQKPNFLEDEELQDFYLHTWGKS